MFTNKRFEHMKSQTLRALKGETAEQATERLIESGWNFPEDAKFDEERREFISSSVEETIEKVADDKKSDKDNVNEKKTEVKAEDIIEDATKMNEEQSKESSLVTPLTFSPQSSNMDVEMQSAIKQIDQELKTGEKLRRYESKNKNRQRKTA